MELAAGREREVLPIVLAGLEIVIVDGDDEIARLDLQVIAIGRTILVDVGHLIEARRVGGEIESRIPCLHDRARVRWTAAHAGVRGVELANHHHHDRVKLFLVDEILQ
jgi:hypothetical protein